MSDARSDIERLIFTCDMRNDAGDFDGVGELFAHATIGIAGMAEVACEGAQGTADQFRSVTRVYPEGGARTHHLSTNLIIEVDEFVIAEFSMKLGPHLFIDREVIDGEERREPSAEPFASGQGVHVAAKDGVVEGLGNFVGAVGLAGYVAGGAPVEAHVAIVDAGNADAGSLEFTQRQQ